MSHSINQLETRQRTSQRWLPQFNISTLLLVVTLCALALGWWKDRSKLQQQLDDRELQTVLNALALAQEFKQDTWSVSSHLGSDTSAVEQALGSHLKTPEGEFASGQGWAATRKLRKASPETFRQVIALLQDEDVEIRNHAVQALALYGEAYHTSTLFNVERDHYNTLVKEAVPKLLPLLNDSNARIRASAALAIGQLAPRDVAAPKLIRAFKHEDDQEAIMYLSWAIRRIF